MKDKISDKDKQDWENFLKSKKKLHNKDIVNKNYKTYKTSSVDLHGHTLEGANKIVESFIIKSYENGINRLRIVTGKGLHSKNESDPFVSKELGILKYSVPEFIKNKKDLMKKILEIKEADIKDGGSGAFYIYLKKSK